MQQEHRHLIPRHARAIVLEALAESRAVALLGPRQAGKSTLAHEISRSAHPALYLTLDDPGTAEAARADPTEWVAGIDGPAVIDEVQRVPELLLAIKMRLDADDTPGQFLLTGSANLLTLPTIADALPGRVEYVRLWPLSQAELRRSTPTFIDSLFEGRVPQLQGAPIGRAALAPLLARGGYPEAQRRSARGLSRFFASYVDSLLQREVADIATLREPRNLGRVLRLVAARSGSLVNVNGIASELGIDRGTVGRQLDLLETLFVIRRLGAWHRNLGSRSVKGAKAYVVDSGLLAYLVGADEDRIIKDGALAGAVLESFVAMELVRLAELASSPLTPHHYRDKQQREVDIVLERHSGEVVGIEVKAGATPREADFAGLRYLRDRLGTQFRAGVLLHSGAQTLRFGDRLAAVPIAALWD